MSMAITRYNRIKKEGLKTAGKVERGNFSRN